MKKVAVVDYKMGNIDSVIRALKECGCEVVIASRKEHFRETSYIILPGVGSFSLGMQYIREKELDKILQEEVFEKGVPFLGICLGMQLLANKGWEDGETEGLGWINGEIKKLIPIKRNERIPHMGWNEVWLQKNSILFKHISNKKDFYFVHSYHFCCDDRSRILAYTPYCGSFVSVIGKDNVYGVQFHPEKSQKVGLKLIQNFLTL